MAASMEMKQAVLDYVGGLNDSSEKVKIIANEINKKQDKFLGFIQCLGEPLANSSNDPVSRSRATRVIGDVISLLPPSFLSSDQANVVATFLLAKLSDHHSVQPSALHSLSVLTSRCSLLPDGLPSQICLTIFREIQNQSLSHADRRSNYAIFENLLASSNRELARMGGDFVIGFIQQMDGEKDPRNLMHVFGCAYHLIATIPLGAFKEEMFEVLGCYFPIDFVPPPNNPHGVTREELIGALRKCLSASADFAPFCMPLLLEKMTADLLSAKVDAFETLIDCAPVFGRKGLTEFIGSLTSILKREVLMDANKELVNSARHALTAVFKAMSPSLDIDDTHDQALATSIVEIYQDISKFLEGSNPNRACLAFSISRAISSSSSKAFLSMMPLAMPAFIQTYSKTTQEGEQTAYLKELNSMLETVTMLSNDDKQKLDFFKLLYDFYESLLNKKCGNDVKHELITGLTYLITILGLISPAQTSSFIKAIVQTALTCEEEVLRKHALQCMKKCLSKHSNYAEEAINIMKDQVNEGNKSWAFDCLAYASVDVQAFHKISSILLSIVSKSLYNDGQWYGLEVVNSLKCLVDNQESSSPTVQLLVDSVILPLMRTCVQLCSQWTVESREKCAHFISACTDVFRLISNKISSSDATNLWGKLCSLLLDGNTESIDYNGDKQIIQPLETSSPWQQTRLVKLLEGFLAGVHVQVIVQRREEIFEALFTLAKGCTDDITHLSACHCVAVILNKATLGSQIHWLLEPIKDNLLQSLEDRNHLDSTERSLQLWVWLTKALECRGHSAAGIFITKLILLIGDPFIGLKAADNIGIIFEDVPTILSLPLYSNITPMYKQRVFTLNLKDLMEGYHNSSKEIQHNYLLAISRIMSNLPQQVLKPHLDKLAPLLLISLDQLTGNSQQSTLDTLTNAVVHTPETVVKHLDSLLPRLLQIANNDSKMAIRISSLKCLAKLSDLPAHTIAPHQNKVVRELANTLDDKKRLVRMQAVNTRNAWILCQADS